MTTSRGGAHEARATDEQVAENVLVLLRRSRTTQQALGVAVGITSQTMSRRIAGAQPWQLWEVVEIARFFDVSLEELTGRLPASVSYRLVRGDQADETGSVRHQGLEPRTRCLGTNPKSAPLPGDGQVVVRPSVWAVA